MLFKDKSINPNGVYPGKGGTLLMAGFKDKDNLRAIYSMAPGKEPVALTDKIGMLDGLYQMSNGDILATDWTSGSLFRWNKKDGVQKLATGFYKHYNTGIAGTPAVDQVYTTNYQDLTTFYTFTFTTGGFVIMAADDASIPVLGYSFDSPMPQEITNPATKEWLDSYSHQVWQIVQAGLDNTATLAEWNALRRGEYDAPARDVSPLLTTTWDQGCYYNTLCPSDPGGSWTCGHVYTGCVATAMAQIMKLHYFPSQGVGSLSYMLPVSGLQSADFGNTTYDWASMPNNVVSNNTPVATIMYHSGVSVNMQYSLSGSGAFSEAGSADTSKYVM